MTAYSPTHIPYEFDLFYDLKTSLDIIDFIAYCERYATFKEHVMELIATYGLDIDALKAQAEIEAKIKEEHIQELLGKQENSEV